MNGILDNWDQIVQVDNEFVINFWYKKVLIVVLGHRFELC